MRRDTSPFVGYYGGKDYLAEWIIKNLPIYHSYVEPFAGGASVFFQINHNQASSYVLNDTNDNLITFYRVAKLSPNKLLKYTAAHGLYSETWHKHSDKILKARHRYNEVDIAWAVWYKVCVSFGGDMDGGYKRATTQGHKVDLAGILTNKIKRLPRQLEILQNASIGNEDAIECIKRYDDVYTCYYVDPPYINRNQGHYKGYTAMRYEALLSALKGIEGKFILSSYVNPVLDKHIKENDWIVDRYKRDCPTARGRTNTGGRVELLVRNYTNEILI